MSPSFSRRRFLQVSATAAGGFLLSVHLPGVGRAEEAVEPMHAWLFVRIEPDGTTVIGARGAEIGQGVKTSLPMLIAEELDVPWSRVKVEQLPFAVIEDRYTGRPASKYGAQGAGGSTSIPDSWEELRQVGAKARHMLMQAAAETWSTDAGELRTADAAVLHPDGRRLAYAELAGRAAKLPLPAEPLPLKPAGEFRVIGQPTPTVDARDIVTGRAEYGIDGELPGALVAVVARSPYFEGRLKRLDAGAAEKVPGVKTVVELPAPDPEAGLVRNLAAGVAVVAEDTWSALKGRDALDVEWAAGSWGDDSTEALAARADKAFSGRGETARSDGDLAAARESAHRTVEARYTMPFLAHCTMEPQNAVVDVRDDKATLIASLQSPGGAARMINSLTGIDLENIDVRLPRSGGGFGRRLENDFVAEAVQIAQAVGRPVKLVWKREDDLQNDWYRPFGVHAMSATLDADGGVTGWSHRVAATDRRFRKPGYADANPWLACLDPDGFPAGCVESYEAEYLALEFGLPRGWWRGPLPTFTAFPVQSFVDEVAAAAGEDPLALRLKLLGEPREMDYRDHGGPKIDTGRIAAVLERAAKEIGYGRELPAGRGIGLAAHFVFGGYTAHAMEVSVEEGKPKVHRCVCVVDVGRVVNPLGVEAQMMSGTIDGISTALNLEITVENGRIVQTNFPNYPVMRMATPPTSRCTSSKPAIRRPVPARWASQRLRRRSRTRSTPPPANASAASRS